MNHNFMHNPGPRFGDYTFELQQYEMYQRGHGLPGANNINHHVHFPLPGPCPPPQQNMQMTRGHYQGPRGQFHGNRGHPGTGQHFQRGHQQQYFHNHDNNGRNPTQNEKRNKRNRNKGNKIDRRDLPENNQFSCDTCDRGFATEEKYKEHVGQHQKCSDPSCSYVAAPKLVKLHFEMHHKTGLARKIWNVESPEDIQRWREERKKNFPTQANIERKKTTDAERRARGEKLETKSFGRRNRFNNHGKQRWENRKRSRDNHNLHCDNDQTPNKKPNTAQSDATKAETTNGDPLSAILLRSDSVNGSPTKDEEKDVGNVAAGLASIMSSYASDSDADETQKSSPIKQEQKDPQPRNSSHQRNEKLSAVSRRSSSGPKKRNRNFEIYYPKQSSLLEKLLAKEIRHERNMLLQCVHYIVKKNFFEVGMEGKKSSAGS